MKAPSFLQRLTGNTNDYDTYDDEYDEMEEELHTREDIRRVANAGAHPETMWEEPDTDEEGELPIDMYETDDAIILNALVAGVKPSDLEISITRDSITVRGARFMPEHVPDDAFTHKELFWGSFSRTVELPDEVVIDEAEAHESHGLLHIILPRLDKNRSARLSIKSLK